MSGVDDKGGRTKPVPSPPDRPSRLSSLEVCPWRLVGAPFCILGWESFVCLLALGAYRIVQTRIADTGFLAQVEFDGNDVADDPFGLEALAKKAGQR